MIKNTICLSILLLIKSTSQILKISHFCNKNNNNGNNQLKLNKEKENNNNNNNGKKQLKLIKRKEKRSPLNIYVKTACK